MPLDVRVPLVQGGVQAAPEDLLLNAWLAGHLTQVLLSDDMACV